MPLYSKLTSILTISKIICIWTFSYQGMCDLQFEYIYSKSVPQQKTGIYIANSNIWENNSKAFVPSLMTQPWLHTVRFMLSYSAPESFIFFTFKWTLFLSMFLISRKLTEIFTFSFHRSVQFNQKCSAALYLDMFFWTNFKFGTHPNETKILWDGFPFQVALNQRQILHHAWITFDRWIMNYFHSFVSVQRNLDTHGSQQGHLH